MRRMTLRETIRVVHGRLPLLAFHLERLAEGGASADLRSRVEHASLLAAESAPPETVRLQVLVHPAEDRCSTRLDACPSSLDVPGGPVIEPVVVATLPALPPCAAKPADRSYWDGAQHLAQLRGAHQAVLVTPDGFVIDGGTANVWAVVGRTLVTPPSPPAIAGVACRVVLRSIAPALGLRAEVRPLPLEELLSADEVLLSNAIGGVVAAAGRGGEVAEELHSAWRDRLALPSIGR